MGFLQLLTSVNAASGGYTISDSDAQAFVTAAGITDNTQKQAIDELVQDLKAASIWTKMTALYPFVGGDATKHSYNLKTPGSYQITWNGTVTHDANGVTGNGSTGYGDTGLNFASVLTLNDVHYSVYSRTTGDTNSRIEIGAHGTTTANTTGLGLREGGFATVYIGSSSQEARLTNADGQGFYVGSRTSSTVLEIYKNGSSLNTLTSANSGTAPSTNVGICARKTSGGAALHSNRNLAFASIGSGLTDTEAANFTTAVETFQDALARGVA
jgi:hypothetical protein